MSCVNCSSNNGKVELTILWQAGSEEFEVHNNIHELNKFTFFLQKMRTCIYWKYDWSFPFQINLVYQLFRTDKDVKSNPWEAFGVFCVWNKLAISQPVRQRNLGCRGLLWIVIMYLLLKPLPGEFSHKASWA